MRQHEQSMKGKKHTAILPATITSAAALCKAVATASLRSFLFILIDQSTGCTEQSYLAMLYSLIDEKAGTELMHMSTASMWQTLGPKLTPPPGRSGVLRDPMRALPVPFWA